MITPVDLLALDHDSDDDDDVDDRTGRNSVVRCKLDFTWRSFSRPQFKRIGHHKLQVSSGKSGIT